MNDHIGGRVVGAVSCGVLLSRYLGYLLCLGAAWCQVLRQAGLWAILAALIAAAAVRLASWAIAAVASRWSLLAAASTFLLGGGLAAWTCGHLLEFPVVWQAVFAVSGVCSGWSWGIPLLDSAKPSPGR